MRVVHDEVHRVQRARTQHAGVPERAKYGKVQLVNEDDDHVLHTVRPCVEDGRVCRQGGRFHLGGEPGLFAWPDQHGGRPGVVARLYEVMGLLDLFSDNPAVVSALREFRARIHYPPGLRGYLVPATNEETLAGQIELLLADQEADQAVEVAAAALDMLERIAPVAEELDPNLGDLGRRLEQVRERLVGAAASH